MRPFFALILLANSLLADTLERFFVVETLQAKAESFIIKRRYIGTIKAENFSILEAKSASTVSKIHVKAEQSVKKGQILVSLANSSSHKARLLAEKKVRSLAKALERQKELLKSQDVTKVHVDQAKRDWLEASLALESQKQILENTEIRAPFDGVVGVPRVVNGESVSPGSAIISITNGPYSLSFLVPPSRLRELSVGQKISVNQKDSHISAIEHSIDPKTRTGFARAIFKDCQSCIVGESVFVYVSVLEKPKAILLNKNALYYDQGKPFIVVVINDEHKQARADIREVTLGQEQDGMVEILSGLMVGEIVVRADPKRLPPKAKLVVAS